MVLRKPYAFLIKHFQKINVVLLALVAFVFYRLTKFHTFVNNYANTGIYNDNLNNVSNYVNAYLILAFLGIIIISSVLLYLLKRKDKPIIAYLVITIVNFAVLILCLYYKHYFTYTAKDGYEVVSAKLLSDFSFIATIPYYVFLFILIIRSMGIDLKNFGFQEDKEFLEINESDREEVEVQVGFDKHKWIRKTKYYIRNSKYFILEHKYQLLLVFAIVALIGIKGFYNYFFVENRVYKMHQTVVSNSYAINVKNTYLTDKGYSGQIVANDGEYFVLVDVDIENKSGFDRTFDIEKMLLYVNNDYYIPNTKYNDYFKDMGNLYKKVAMKGRSKKSYLIVYKVPKPDKKANFVLKYQDLTAGNAKLVQIKIKLVDISKLKTKGTGAFPNEFIVPLNLNESMTFKIKEFDFKDSIGYSYKVCDITGSCPMTTSTYNAPSGKLVLEMKFSYDGDDKQDFVNFASNYGRIRYKVNDETKEVPIKNAISRNYKGNYLYIVVPKEMKKASNITMVFVVRSYQYTYKLKGGTNN